MTDLTVVTLNLHAGQRPRRVSTPRFGQHRPRAVGPSSNGAFDMIKVLRSFDADVLVLQEVWWPDDGQDSVALAAANRGASVHAVTFGRGHAEPWPHYLSTKTPRGRLGIAVVSQLPVQFVANLPLGHLRTDPAPNRHAQWLTLDVDGHDLDLIAVHLSSRLPYAPPMQLRNLRRQLPPRDRLAVLAGDFNLWGPAVSAMLPGWRRAVRGRTWPAHRPHSQIDHVLVRDDVEVVDAEVLDDVGSDHRPVRVTLRLR